MRRVNKKYRKRKQKSIYKTKIFWFALIISGSLISFLMILAFNPFYQLKFIRVEGLNLTTEGSIKSFSMDRFGSQGSIELKSLPLFSTNKIKHEILKSYPHIGSIEIKKEFPDTLNLIVTEREKEFLWCLDREGDSCYDIDSDGVVFRKRSSGLDQFKVVNQLKEEVHLGEEAVSKEVLLFIMEAKRRLENIFIVEKMIIPTPKSLFVQLENFEIRFNLEDDLSQQLERLEILLEKEIREMDNLEYIELRYGNSVYYKK